jgi:hypothetical protein
MLLWDGHSSLLSSNNNDTCIVQNMELVGGLF